MTRTILATLAAPLIACFAPLLFAAGPVTLDSLLEEMLSRSSLCEFPSPAYTCRQASSYDRRAKVPNTSDWFANADQGNFVREEVNQGRKEWVLMDENGPGAIVRWWITAAHYRTTFRIYSSLQKICHMASEVYAS